MWCFLWGFVRLGFLVPCGKKGNALTFTPPAPHPQGGYGRAVVECELMSIGVGRQADMPDGVSHMIHS